MRCLIPGAGDTRGIHRERQHLRWLGIAPRKVANERSRLTVKTLSASELGWLYVYDRREEMWERFSHMSAFG